VNDRTKPSGSGSKYDIIHFEALGPEAEHLKEEITKAQQNGELPKDHEYLITPSTVQEYLKENQGVVLPDIITTKTHSTFPETYLAGARKSIITRSAGYDHVEDLADKANIASLREYCVNAVAQTAMKLLYVTAGELNHYTKNAETFERKDSKAFLELNEDVILTVFGVGKIGRRIYDLSLANGLTVQGVDIRQKELDEVYQGQVNFVSKEHAIGSSNIIINAMNLTKNEQSRFHNVGYFSEEFLSKAQPGLIFINVTRGEIAPESNLLALYESGKLRGVGLDVFSDEAQFAALLNAKEQTDAGKDHLAAIAMVRSSLARDSNIYVQPHQGFNSDVAAKAKAVEAIKHVVSWYKNNGRCFDEQLPYY
jgi:D-lactate dehydrogenase